MYAATEKHAAMDVVSIYAKAKPTVDSAIKPVAEINAAIRVSVVLTIKVHVAENVSTYRMIKIIVEPVEMFALKVRSVKQANVSVQTIRRSAVVSV